MLPDHEYRRLIVLEVGRFESSLQSPVRYMKQLNSLWIEVPVLFGRETPNVCTKPLVQSGIPHSYSRAPEA